MDLNKFKLLPILGIMRGVELDVIEPLTRSIVLSGLKSIEITMNSKDPCKLLAKLKKTAQGKLMLGAGTVLDTDTLKSALDSGATFIVTPGFIKSVQEYCVKNKIPIFTGAFSPSEIYLAWQNGASYVKVFPARTLGPAFFKEVKGPFCKIKLLACAGVNARNLNEYFSHGADAIAFGASIFNRELLEKKDFSKIEQSIRAIIKAYEQRGVVE